MITTSSINHGGKFKHLKHDALAILEASRKAIFHACCHNVIDPSPKCLVMIMLISTVGPRYMREIGTPKIGLHIRNSHIKRPRMTVN
jgi:hypothetical protein